RATGKSRATAGVSAGKFNTASGNRAAGALDDSGPSRWQEGRNRQLRHHGRNLLEFLGASGAEDSDRADRYFSITPGERSSRHRVPHLGSVPGGVACSSASGGASAGATLTASASHRA